MPTYPGTIGGTVPAPSSVSGLGLQKGDQQYLFGVLSASATQLPVNDFNVAAEAAPAGASVASISVNIQMPVESGPPPSISLEVRYPSAPGAGEILAIQEADTDADAFYITPVAAAYTITPGGSGVFRTDLSPTGGRFIRVLRTKGANAVACTVKISRLA